MKISISTYYRYNYGSCLQAFALSHVLKKNGDDVEILNYESNYLKCLIKELKYKSYYFSNNNFYKTLKKFNEWNQKNLNISKVIYGENKLKEKINNYDISICGSDQIWNNKKGYINPLYYLPFTLNKIAYAPSFGKDIENINNLNETLKLIKNFKYISLREKTNVELLKKDYNISTEHVLDPTLLLDKEEWSNVIDKQNYEKKYVLVYLLTKNDDYTKEIEKFSKENNLEIVNLAILANDNNGNLIADPFDFINLIKNAEFIFTDSYHGSIFSIIFEKKIYILKRFKDDDISSQNIRLYDLIDLLGIKNILIESSDISKVENKKNIDYIEVKKIIEKNKEKSLKFLKNSIDDFRGE